MAYNQTDRGSIPNLRHKLLNISQMDVVGQPCKELGAEAYNYVTIDTPNDMPSDLILTAKSLMGGRKNNQTKNVFNVTYEDC